MIDSCRVGYGREASSPPDAPPGATIATTAATKNPPPIAARGPSLPLILETSYPGKASHLSLPAVSRSLTVAAACLALLLTACGGSDKPKAAKSTATTAEASATATAALDENHCTPAKNPGEQKRAKLKKPTETLDASRTYVATVDTNCGAFEITLDAKRAPKTGGSFKYLADRGFYDGLLIHRIVPGFVFQGGDPEGSGQGGPGYTVVEAPPKDLEYDKYVVAMAKTGSEPAGASGSQFFVVTGADAQQLTPDYALLGKVTSGKDVVDKIGAIITDPRSDFPDDPVLIESISVEES
jgi:peptidyl-prolyl cis-trans isomerase B (cyclophilin B)